MKALAIVTVVGALAVPTLAFAQSASPVTRAQVRDDLNQLEQAGYTPAENDNAHYPDRIVAAEKKVSEQNDAQYTNDATGGVSSGTSASGAPVHTRAQPPMHNYGESPYRCSGPHSFCNVYFGN